jgi:hypothetical protein
MGKANSKPSTGSSNKGNTASKMKKYMSNQEQTTPGNLLKSQRGSKYGTK